jgi:hypothetical protein
MLYRGHLCGMLVHFETTTSTITAVRLLTEHRFVLIALKGGVLVRPKNVGELRPQQADLSGSGWYLAGLAMRGRATGERGATEIFTAVAGWLRLAATGDPADLCSDSQWLVAVRFSLC